MTKIDLSRKIEIPGWVDALLKPTKIGSGELERQWEEIGDEVMEVLKKVMPTGKYTLGPYLKKFEEEFAEFSDSKYGIGMSSGTKAALHIALEAMGVGPGDEVITVCNTYVATAFAISYCGATPVFVDIDPKTYNLTAELVEKKITPKTKAIVPVHLYGQVVDMDPIMDLAEEAQPVRAGRCFARARRLLQRPPGGFIGPRGRLLVISQQEHGRLWRRWCHYHQRPRIEREDPHAALCRPAREIHSRSDRLPGPFG